MTDALMLLYKTKKYIIKCFCAFILIGTSKTALSQNSECSANQKIWDVTNSVANDRSPICVASDGSIIATEVINIYESNTSSLTLKKYSSGGVFLWERNLSTEPYNITYNDIIEAFGGGYLLIGAINPSENTPLPDGFGGSDVLIVKIDINGNKEWEKIIGGAKNELANNVIKTPTNEYIIFASSNSDTSGNKNSFNRGDYDYWVIKIDQTGNIIWEKAYGGSEMEIISSGILTTDNHILVVGESSSNSSSEKTENRKGRTDYWILKLDMQGNVVWDKTFGGLQGVYPTGGVIETENGDYIIAGHTESIFYNDKSDWNKGSFDYWLVRIDTSGNKIWDKTIGGNGDDRMVRIIKNSQHKIFLVGHTNSDKSEDKSSNKIADLDYWLVNIDDSGKVVWDKTVGSTGYDELFDVEVAENNSIVLYGFSGGEAGYDKSESSNYTWRYWILKYSLTPIVTIPIISNEVANTGESAHLVAANCNGDVLWYDSLSEGNLIYSGNPYITPPLFEGKSYYVSCRVGNCHSQGRTKVDVTIGNVCNRSQIIWDKTLGSTDDDIAISVCLTTDGGSLVLGESFSSGLIDKSDNNRHQKDLWLIKLDNNGNKVWDKIFGVSMQNNATKIIPTADGGALLIGSSIYAELLLFKVDYSGNLQWHKGFSGKAYTSLIKGIQLNNGDFIIASTHLKSINNFDYWILRINSIGEEIWNKSFGGDSHEFSGDITQLTDGNIVIVGTSGSNSSGDKSENIKGFLCNSVRNINNKDFWIIKIDLEGRLIWEKTIGGDLVEQASSIVATPNAGFTVSGISGSHVSFDKTDDKISQYGGTSFWIVGFDSDCNVLWDQDIATFYESNGNATLIKLRNGGYIVGGSNGLGVSSEKSEKSKGKMDYWVVKLDETGRIQWDRTIGSNEDDGLNDLIETQDGNLLIVGGSNGSKSLDKSEYSRGLSDIWVVKLSLTPLSPTPNVALSYINNGSNSTSTILNASGCNGNIDWYDNKDMFVGTGYQFQTPTLSASASYLARCITQGCTSSFSGKGEVLNCSEPLKLWDKTLGGDGKDYNPLIFSDSDSTVLTLGTSRSSCWANKNELQIGRADFWLVKQDKNGKKVWGKLFGGISTDEATSITKTIDNNFLLGGNSLSDISGNKTSPSKGLSDFWIVKIDNQGSILWDKSFGGANNDYLKKIVPLNDGSYLLFGDSYSNSSGDKSNNNYSSFSDLWIVKIDGNGNKLWDKTIGSRGDDFFSSAVIDKDGNIYIAGTAYSSISFDKTSEVDTTNSLNTRQDFWLIKLNSLGNIIWDKSYGGIEDDSAVDLISDELGNFIMVGSSNSDSSFDKTESLNGQNDIWVIKINKEGDIIWDKSFGGDSNDTPKKVLLANDGGCFVLGSSYSNASGNKSSENKGDSDYWCFYISESGEKTWDKSFGGNGFDSAYDFTITSRGHIYISGNSSSNSSGDKTENSREFYSFDTGDFWIIKATIPPSLKLSVQNDSIILGQSATLKAIGCQGGDVSWYNMASSNQVIQRGITFQTPPIEEKVSYFAECTFNNCTSSAKKEILISPICPSSINHSRVGNPAAKLYKAANHIKSEAKVESGTTYQAGNFVLLLPGFEVEVNKTFYINIKGCDK